MNLERLARTIECLRWSGQFEEADQLESQLAETEVLLSLIPVEATIH